MILASSSARQGHLRKGHLRGFTLIELLVVIAIIGILSAIVLAALNTARAKGIDAQIKSDLNTVQTEAALDYDGNNQSYGSQAGAIASGATIAAQTGAPGSSTLFGAGGDSSAGTAITQAALDAYGANTGGVNNLAWGSNGSAFVIAVRLTSPSPATWWCVDSLGTATSTTVAPTAGLVTANYSCVGL